MYEFEVIDVLERPGHPDDRRPFLQGGRALPLGAAEPSAPGNRDGDGPTGLGRRSAYRLTPGWDRQATEWPAGAWDNRPACRYSCELGGA
jgi:hypothetical protein